MWPSVGAWQRQLTQNARYATEQVLGIKLGERQMMSENPGAPEAKLERFRGLVEAQQRERYLRQYPHSPEDLVTPATTTRIHIGKKYARVDVGQSGKYMVDLASGEILGIKAYGVPHPGHRYGTLDTIDSYYWGGYRAVRRNPLDALRSGVERAAWEHGLHEAGAGVVGHSQRDAAVTEDSRATAQVRANPQEEIWRGRTALERDAENLRKMESLPDRIKIRLARNLESLRSRVREWVEDYRQRGGRWAEIAEQVEQQRQQQRERNPLDLTTARTEHDLTPGFWAPFGEGYGHEGKTVPAIPLPTTENPNLDTPAEAVPPRSLDVIPTPKLNPTTPLGGGTDQSGAGGLSPIVTPDSGIGPQRGPDYSADGFRRDEGEGQVMTPRLNPKTVVIFRLWKETADVIALFPEVPADVHGRFMLSYERVGQHGGADGNAIVARSRSARPTEYADLKRELEGLGYSLDVKQRITSEMNSRRHAAARWQENPIDLGAGGRDKGSMGLAQRLPDSGNVDEGRGNIQTPSLNPSGHSCPRCGKPIRGKIRPGHYRCSGCRNPIEVRQNPKPGQYREGRPLACPMCGRTTSGKRLLHTDDCPIGKFKKEYPPKRKRNPKA